MVVKMTKLHDKIKKDRTKDVEKDYQLAKQTLEDDGRYEPYTRDDYARDTEDSGYEEFTPAEIRKWKKEYPKAGKSKVFFRPVSFRK